MTPTWASDGPSLQHRRPQRVCEFAHSIVSEMLHRSLRRIAPLKRALSSAAAAKKTDRLIIFDTTLRDGEQAPGCTLQIGEKIIIGELSGRGKCGMLCR